MVPFLRPSSSPRVKSYGPTRLILFSISRATSHFRPCGNALLPLEGRSPICFFPVSHASICHFLDRFVQFLGDNPSLPLTGLSLCFAPPFASRALRKTGAFPRTAPVFRFVRLLGGFLPPHRPLYNTKVFLSRNPPIFLIPLFSRLLDYLWRARQGQLTLYVSPRSAVSP